MSKKLKFTSENIYGFVYDGEYGGVRLVYDTPLSKREIELIEDSLGDDDILFTSESIDDIIAMWDLDLSGESDEYICTLEEADFNIEYMKEHGTPLVVRA